MWLWSIPALAYTLGEPHDVAEPVSIQQGGLSWRLASGTLVPVLDDEAQPSGFVFLGESSGVLAGGSERQRHVLANRLVAFLDVPTEEARALGEGAGLELDIDGAVVLGVRAWEAVAPVARSLRDAGDRVVMRGERDGTESVLVEGHRRLGRDLRVAERWLRERTTWMDEVGVEPAGILAADRWEQQAGTDAPGRWVASLHTDLDWGRYAGDTVLPRVEQPWLEGLVDPAGVLDPRAPASWWAHGPEGPMVRVSKGTWPDGLAPRRVDAVGYGVRAYFAPETGGQAARLGVTTDVAITAVGGPVTTVVIDVPHTEQVAWEDRVPLPNGFELGSVSVPDGPELEVRPLSIGRQDEDRGFVRTFAVRLQRPLAEGATTLVRVETIDRHRYAHIKVYDPERWVAASFGTTTGLVPVLPEVRGSTGRAPVHAIAGVAAQARKAHVVSSHDVLRRWQTDTGRWVEVEGDTRSFQLAAGKWLDEQVAAADGLPSLGLHPLHAISEFDRVAHAVQDTIRLYQPVLGPIPQDHLEVLESFRASDRPGVGVANAVLSSTEVQVMNERLTLFGGARMALALHEQWWMPHDIDPEDGPLPIATAWVYALGAMAAVDGPRAAARTWDVIRTLTKQPPGPTSSLPHVLYALGPTLADDAGGDVALVAAVDQVLQGAHPASWDGLGAALTEATGRDYQGFLLTWVHTGVTPRVDVTVGPDGIEATTDLPFGALALPVEVDGVRDHVRIVDGHGRLELVSAQRVKVDPDGLLPLRGLAVRRDASRR